MSSEQQAMSPGKRFWSEWRAFVLAGALVAALALLGAAQYAVDSGSPPFHWPGDSWLDGQFADAFGQQNARNALTFAAPLFLLGAAGFGIAAARATSVQRIIWKAAPIELTRPQGVLAILSTGGMLWLIVSLFLGSYHPAFRFVFVSAIGSMILALLAGDVLRGRLGTRPCWPQLVELLLVLALVGTFVGINIRDLSSWRYSSIGDEAGFFQVGNRILDDSHFNWFGQRGGVGNIHPVLGSVWHAANMLVFGRDIFGWKMGALTAIAITIPAFYWLMRELFRVRSALFATMFLAASHYLFAYAHTGYNNIFALFPTVAALACLIAGLKRGSPALLFASGVFAGLGFYTFHSARATILLLAVTLAVTRDRHAATRAALWIVPAFAVTVLPIFATGRWSVISATTGQSVFEANDPVLKHISNNVLASVFGFSFNPYKLHYVAGALLDGVTLPFTVAGLGLAFARLRHAAYQIVILWFAIALAVAGVFSLHGGVSISRLSYALPPLAACAGLALDALIDAFAALKRDGLPAPALTVFALAAIAPTVFILNGRQFFIYTPHHARTTGNTVIMRAVLDPACDKQPLRDIVYSGEPDSSLDLTFSFYQREDRRPVLLAYEDIGSTYIADPTWGGTGCLIAANVEAGPGKELVDGWQAQGVASRTLTDISGDSVVRLIEHPGAAPPAAADPAGAWKTDFSRGTGLDGAIKAQQRDFLKAIDNPVAVALDDAPLDSREPVAVVSIQGSVRAYPLRFLLWHGVIEDTLHGVPIAVTYDPISGTTRAFARNVGRRTLTFAITGYLRDGNALLYDRQTESWWQQATGRAITGALAGAQLVPVDLRVVSGSVVQAAGTRSTSNFDTMAPPRASIPYPRNPYLHYESLKGKPLFVRGTADERLEPLRRVLLVDTGSGPVAVPYPNAEQARGFAATVDVSGTRVLLFYEPSTASELDARRIFNSRSVGSFAAFRAPADRQFQSAGTFRQFFADDKGNVWDMLGNATDGPDEGATLTPVTSVTSFWFSASATYPGIKIAELE